MPRAKTDPKADALREKGCLHPQREKVTDEAFAESEFFDPRDLVQVKYEMLRRVRIDGQPVSHSAKTGRLAPAATRPVFAPLYTGDPSRR